jgi:DNA primase
MGPTSANIGLKITSQRECRVPFPVHSGKDPNFAVNAETGLARCHSQCGRGWDVVTLEMEIVGLDFALAKERVFDLVRRPRVPWEEPTSRCNDDAKAITP